jgi:hypothetical protein
VRAAVRADVLLGNLNPTHSATHSRPARNRQRQIGPTRGSIRRRFCRWTSRSCSHSVSQFHADDDAEAASKRNASKSNTSAQHSTAQHAMAWPRHNLACPTLHCTTQSKATQHYASSISPPPLLLLHPLA